MRANRGSLGDTTLNTDRHGGGSQEPSAPPPAPPSPPTAGSHPQLWPQGTWSSIALSDLAGCPSPT